MRCKEIGCNGIVDENASIPTETISDMGESVHADRVYYCVECGRVHWPSGRFVFDQFGDQIFYVDGVIIHRGKNSIRVNRHRKQKSHRGIAGSVRQSRNATSD